MLKTIPSDKPREMETNSKLPFTCPATPVPILGIDRLRGISAAWVAGTYLLKISQNANAISFIDNHIETAVLKKTK
jgi:hypothetical protein